MELEKIIDLKHEEIIKNRLNLDLRSLNTVSIKIKKTGDCINKFDINEVGLHKDNVIIFSLLCDRESIKKDDFCVGIQSKKRDCIPEFSFHYNESVVPTIKKIYIISDMIKYSTLEKYRSKLFFETKLKNISEEKIKLLLLRRFDKVFKNSRRIWNSIEQNLFIFYKKEGIKRSTITSIGHYHKLGIIRMRNPLILLAGHFLKEPFSRQTGFLSHLGGAIVNHKALRNEEKNKIEIIRFN